MLTLLVEIIGYIGRAMSSKQSPNWTLGPYIVQTLFLLLAPALLAASIYMLLGRIILVLQAESHALLKKKWLTKIFVTGDVLSFLLQGAGTCLLKNFLLSNSSLTLSRRRNPVEWQPICHEDWRAHHRRRPRNPNIFLRILHDHRNPLLPQGQEVSVPAILFSAYSLEETHEGTLLDELLYHGPFHVSTHRVHSRK